MLLYTSQRGSDGVASMDRSASFRENRENPILPALSNMSKGNSSATQGDIAAFLQCLRFDPKQMVTNHKLNRPVDFKRLACLSVGLPAEESSSMPLKAKQISSPSPEEFRRLKASLRESCTKARERVKIFNESLSGMNKLFPTIQSRKRSRPDAVGNDRSNPLYPPDRSILGSNIAKLVSQNQASTSGFELEQKSKEGAEGIPSKRTRTSMVDPRMDARTNTPARPAGIVDRDKEVLKIPNISSIQSEDIMLHVAVDGWEKSKMKKKRSGIKSDVAGSSAATKPVDGSRDARQGMHRLLSDPRSRITDTHGFRTSYPNGGVAKADGAAQQMGSGPLRVSRADQDNTPLLHNNKDHALEKEKVNLKPINKSAREDLSSGSPTSSTKLNARARAPRSGSSVGLKLSPSVSRANSGSDWELSQCTSKVTTPTGINSRKRTTSVRSSSPPVAQWATHRPQKISRSARRSNFVSILQSDDGSPSTLDSAAGNERLFIGSSAQQGKFKGDHLSSSTISESEESGPTELKSKEKSKISDDMDEKSVHNVQKMSNLMLPPRKSKNINGEDSGDGIRRKGRTGRGFTSARSLTPLGVEKLGNVGKPKQLRSVKLGPEKAESRTGRPPSRKLSDRKAYSRQKHVMVSASADFLDDGHEELLAATNAVVNPAQALSAPFWSQMEPLFRFISEGDLRFIKQQATSEPTLSSPTHVPSGLESTGLVASSHGLNDLGRGLKSKYVENCEELLPVKIRTLGEVSLCQKLIAALIPEQDEEHFYTENDSFYESELETGKDVQLSNTQMFQNHGFSEHHTSDGCCIDANGRSLDEMEHIMHSDNLFSVSDVGADPMYDNAQNGLLSDRTAMPGSDCSQLQYVNMSINEKIMLEFNCIGIFPEIGPVSEHTEDGEVAREIAMLNDKYHEHVSKRKRLLDRLSKSVEEGGELQETEFEQLALDKLVGMAYEKYMSCWGRNGIGMKSASGKIAKQSALAFVRRTLDRCQEFENTGKSCFSEPLLRNMFLSGVAQLRDAYAKDAISDGGLKVGKGSSVHFSTQQSPSSENLLSVVNIASEQTFGGKEDTWSTRVRKKELLLENVGGGGVIGGTSGIGSSFTGNAKGKRSERDRIGTTKLGRPEKKSKAKPKQKATELTVSVNGLLRNTSIIPNPSHKESNDSVDYNLDELDDPIDLSGLQIPEMDVLGGVPEDLEGQGQDDIGSWLNIDDEGLQDHDFMGLEIPMDDLSELKMMV